MQDLDKIELAALRAENHNLQQRLAELEAAAEWAEHVLRDGSLALQRQGQVNLASGVQDVADRLRSALGTAKDGTSENKHNRAGSSPALGADSIQIGDTDENDGI